MQCTQRTGGRSQASMSACDSTATSPTAFTCGHPTPMHRASRDVVLRCHQMGRVALTRDVVSLQTFRKHMDDSFPASGLDRQNGNRLDFRHALCCAVTAAFSGC
eukprot:2695434-Rhodomonas_salina.1